MSHDVNVTVQIVYHARYTTCHLDIALCCGVVGIAKQLVHIPAFVVICSRIGLMSVLVDVVKC